MTKRIMTWDELASERPDLIEKLGVHLEDPDPLAAVKVGKWMASDPDPVCVVYDDGWIVDTGYVSPMIWDPKLGRWITYEGCDLEEGYEEMEDRLCAAHPTWQDDLLEAAARARREENR
jgi:hypothetical protein